MMTHEQVLERLETIMAAFPQAGEMPICEFLAQELDIEHEQAHKLAHGAIMASTMRGMNDVVSIYMLGAAMGHKWGLIDAANMMEADSNNGS